MLGRRVPSAAQAEAPVEEQRLPARRSSEGPALSRCQNPCLQDPRRAGRGFVEPLPEQRGEGGGDRRDHKLFNGDH